MITRYDAAYYEELQGRLRALLVEFDRWLSTQQATFLTELIDANECGIALEIMSDLLREADARVDKTAADEAAGLAERMHLNSSVGEKLRAQASE
jgi:hypothetical protein